MTSTVIAFVTSASFALWLIRRRSKLRGTDKPIEIRSIAGRDALSEEDAPVLEAGEPSSYSDSPKAEEVDIAIPLREPATEPAELLETAHIELNERMPEFSPLQQTECLVHNEDVQADIILGNPTGSIPLPEDNNSERCESPTSNQSPLDIEENADFDGSSRPLAQGLPNELTISVGAETSASTHYQQPEQDTSQIAVAADVRGEEPPEIGIQTGPIHNLQDPENPEDTGDVGAPKRYRPPVQRAPRQGVLRTQNQERNGSEPSETIFGIRLRVTFDRFGFCTIGLLPERATEDLDTEIAVRSGGTSLYLIAQEDWYQDIPIGGFESRLRQGIELRGRLANQRYVRWLLTGRDVFVLAHHPRASGFVSTAKLTLGRSHVVLCAAELTELVESLLKASGCDGYTWLDESHGLPSGWVGFRDVLPTTAIPLEPGSDPFYAIKPAPEIDIELEGGVRIHHSVWLAGYPPQVKLYGEPAAAVKILMDGKEVRASAEGLLAVEGFDLPGQHSIYCEGVACSRTYSIEEPPENWETWYPYHFGEASVCGPLVDISAEACGGHAFTGPMSNPLLLGAEPGQIFHCSSRNVTYWKGLVPFEVVWALPAQPILCDKKTARILQFAETPVLRSKTQQKFESNWYRAILDASRKGLQIENGSPNSREQWGQYKKTARNIRRGRR